MKTIKTGMELRRGDLVVSTVNDNGITYVVTKKHRDGTLTVTSVGLPCEGGGDKFRCRTQSLQQVID